MYNKVESRGAIFPRQKKSEKSPDMTGDFILTGETLDYVAQQLQSGSGQIKLYVSAWRNVGRGNQPYNSFIVRPPMESQDQQQPQRQQDYGNNYPSRTQGNAPARPGYPQQQHNPSGAAAGARTGGFVGNNPSGYAQQSGRSNGGQRLHSGFNAERDNSEYGVNHALSFPGDDEAPF
jgi:hypothetical protein